jgi:hypothetical protein
MQELEKRERERERERKLIINGLFTKDDENKFRFGRSIFGFGEGIYA